MSVHCYLSISTFLFYSIGTYTVSPKLLHLRVTSHVHTPMTLTLISAHILQHCTPELIVISADVRASFTRTTGTVRVVGALGTKARAARTRADKTHVNTSTVSTTPPPVTARSLSLYLIVRRQFHSGLTYQCCVYTSMQVYLNTAEHIIFSNDRVVPTCYSTAHSA